MTPVRYRHGVEQPADDEAETFAKIAEVFTSEAEAVCKKEGHAMRASHAKATGLLTGELVVEDGLPDELAQGLFAKAGTYEVLARFAQGPGELLDDKVSTHRGVGLKILGVEGERIAESGEEATQDLIFEPGRAFINSNPKTFLANFRMGVSNAPKMPQAVKSAVSAASRVAEAGLEAVGLESKTLGFFGHPSLHPLAENYFTQVPMRYGDHIAKLALVPSASTLVGIGEEEIDAGDNPNAFRDAMVGYFARQAAEFDLRVQLCTDLDAMPIEDAATEWSQDDSEYRTVAKLKLPAQPAYSEARRRYFDEGLSFQPAHSLAAHRPLGGIMRARLAVYPQMLAFRQSRNGAAPIEPRSIAEVPS